MWLVTLDGAFSSLSIYDLEFYEKYVRVKIPILDNLNLLIGNHYFPPDGRQIRSYNTTHSFRFIEISWTPTVFVLLWLGISAPLALTGIMASVFLTAIITLNLKGVLPAPPGVYFTCTETVGSSNHDLIFPNFSDINNTFLGCGIIKPDTHHPPLDTDIILPLVSPLQNFEYSCRKFTSGDYNKTSLGLWLVFCVWSQCCRRCCRQSQRYYVRWPGTGNCVWFHH
jgi:hypothetical protein